MSFIYVLYTGGTFGMNHKSPLDKTSPLVPKKIDEVILKLKGFNFIKKVNVHKRKLSLLEFKNFNILLDTFDHAVDSSDLNQKHWQKMSEFVNRHYDKAKGFIIIQGSDTLAYSASALSFMLKNLNKPVVMTGAKLPIFFKNSDALANFKLALSSIIKKKVTNKVWIAFGGDVMLGCATTKTGIADKFFATLKMPVNLADVEDEVAAKFLIKVKMKARVMPLFVSPALKAENLKSLMQLSQFDAFIFMTYGSGNFSLDEAFRLVIKRALDKGKIVAVVSQVPAGQVLAGSYGASFCSIDDRIINLKNMTIEAAITKFMWASANLTGDEVADFMALNQVGEMA